MEKELTEIDDKLRLLLTQPDNVKCPVCQTDLGAAGLEHISTHYNSEKQSKSESLKNIAAAVVQKKAASKTTELEISKIEKTLAGDKAQAQTRFGVMEREISRAEESGLQ